MRFARKAARLWGFIGLLFINPFYGFGDVAGEVLVYAWDSSSGEAPPPSTSTSLDGGTSQSFGTNDLVTFGGYYNVGTHTVEVATASNGYLLRQSPTDPDGGNDPTSDYGNPRHIEITQSNSYVPVSFQFDPVVTASAVVRDAWTMERIEDAGIEFIFAGSTGSIVVSKYPWTAEYATNWVSDAEGNFPSNTILYLSDYDLDIDCSGYELFSSNNIISNASAGAEIDLGTLFLHPIDNNTNQIADAWETLYFGSGSNVVASADADGDGMGNRDEYIAGTDPTNWYSCLWLEPISSSNGFELAWYTEPDRTYCISGTTNLAADTWVQVGGAWEATNGQIEMIWAETNLNLSWNSNYRVEVVPCWWQGTNQVLIHTNSWTGGEGSTNSWPGGPPPLP